MVRIYLDHHATTPLVPAAREAMVRAMDTFHGNPSSVHGDGRRARALLEDSREALAAALGASPRELVFTSGGTEAVHLAVGGVGKALRPTRVVCDPGAHPCLRAACESLARSLAATFVWAPAMRDPLTLATVLGEGTLLAVSLVQHETGAVADLSAVRDAVGRTGATLVLDAVQAPGKIPLDLGTTGAVAAAVSAHKIGGPAGTGALWLRAGARAVARQAGGGQERGLRAGTENVLGAVGFAAAARQLPARHAAMADIRARRDRIERALVALGAVVNGGEGARAPTACHVSLPGVTGQELVAALDLEGYAVSSGAACSSGRAEPSESLLRLYPSEPWRASAALRVTLGPETSDDEVDAVLKVLPALVARVRDGG